MTVCRYFQEFVSIQIADIRSLLPTMPLLGDMYPVPSLLVVRSVPSAPALAPFAGHLLLCSHGTHLEFVVSRIRGSCRQ